MIPPPPPIGQEVVVEICWLHKLWVLNTNHTQCDNCVAYRLLGPCLTSLTHDIQGTSGWAQLCCTQLCQVSPSNAPVWSFFPYQHWPSPALSPILLSSAPLYSNLPPASLGCGLQLIRGKLGQHWLDDEAGRQPHRLAVPQGWSVANCLLDGVSYLCPYSQHLHPHQHPLSS